MNEWLALLTNWLADKQLADNQRVTLQWDTKVFANMELATYVTHNALHPARGVVTFPPMIQLRKSNQDINN